MSEASHAAEEARIPGWASTLAAIVGGPLALILGAVVALVATVAAVGLTTDSSVLEGAVARLDVVGPSVVAQGLGLCLVPVLAALATKQAVGPALGFRGAPALAFVLGPIGILALGPTSDALVRAMQALAPTWTFDALAQIEALANAYPGWMLWPFLALVPGFSEEIFFRGLIQRSWGRGLKAITISALTFSLFHMDPHHVAGVIPLGFYLAWLGARTNSLWVCILTHTVNNTFAILGSKLADGSDEALPWWAMPVGWLIAAGAIYGIHRATRVRESAGPGEP